MCRVEGNRVLDEAGHARVRMVARPASVPVARRFVDDALTRWGQEAIVDDVGLCVSELCTNATLHSGSHFFELELEQQRGGLRVAVLDTGRTAADSLAARTEFTDALLEELTPDDAATTGRGMFIVSALASAWGIDELSDGKCVWALFGDGEGADRGEEGYAARGPAITHRPNPEPEEPADSGDWVEVRFLGCPAALLLAHDENLADTIRELQLVGADLQRPRFRKLAELLSGHVQRHAVNWDAARMQALEAVRAGDELTDVHVLAPREVMRDVRFLRELVWEAEALARDGLLMTLPAPEPVQELRDWLEDQFRAQAERGEGPMPYPDWLGCRPTRTTVIPGEAAGRSIAASAAPASSSATTSPTSRSGRSRP